MEVILQVAKINSSKDIEIFSVRVNETNYHIIRENQKLQHQKIVNILKEYKTAGLIKSIHRPKNKQMKEHLKELNKTRNIMKKAIFQITQVFK